MFRIRWEKLVFQDFVRFSDCHAPKRKTRTDFSIPSKAISTFLFVELGEEQKINEWREREERCSLFLDRVKLNRQTSHGYCFIPSSCHRQCCCLHRHCLLCPCQTFYFVPTCRLGHSSPNRLISYTTSSRFRPATSLLVEKYDQCPLLSVYHC